MDYRLAQQDKTAMAGIGYAQNAQSVEVSTPIRDRISANEQLLSELHNQIDLLEKRLDTVTTPVAPTPAQTQTGNPAPRSQPNSSHVSGRLDILNEGYMHAIGRLSALRDRVEL